MFIYNVKINKTVTFKIILLIVIILLLILMGTIFIRLFTGALNSDNSSENTVSYFETNTILNKNQTYTLQSSNYTNVLKSVHDNIDNYIRN